MDRATAKLLRVIDDLEDYQATVADLMKRLRGDRSQEDFAKLIGTSNVYLSMIEHGRAFPSLAFLRRVKRAVGE
jgi:transcriptional regulator with XRE-family HTH domain